MQREQLRHIKIFIVVTVLLALFGDMAQAKGPFSAPLQTPPPAASSQANNGVEKIAPEVLAEMQSLPKGEMLAVIVTLTEQANLNSLRVQGAPDRAWRNWAVVTELQSTANLGQRGLKALLGVRRAEGLVSQVTYFWIFNGLAVTTTPEVIRELAALPQVLKITSNKISLSVEPIPPPEQGQIGAFSTQPNLSLINVPALWAMSFKGQGIVVANVDTGVDVNHPQLGPKWRGGTNSWYDPYGQHGTPTDLSSGISGHGTQIMGIMVGGEDNGVAFGIAPEAKWIAVKMFPDSGPGGVQVAKVHLGLQWLLDPDGNPATDDAPHVVSNSWTYGASGCYLEFQPDLQALRAAGILPIFAAGNSGPNASTSHSPGNYPEAFAVGAVNNSDVIKSDSSRGPRPTSPSGCNDGTVFPEVVAPGVSIHTTDLYGLYFNASGTSFATPHVAGALALLLDASPNLTAAEQESLLLNNVVDLGNAGPDNTYGYGRINILAAYQSIFTNQVYLPVVIK